MFPGFIIFRVFGLDILKTYSDSQPFTHIDKSEELSSKTCITLSGTFLCCPYITSTWNFLMWLCLNTPDRRIFLQLQGNLPTFSILRKLEYMLFFFVEKRKRIHFCHFRCPRRRNCWSAIFFMSLSSAWHFQFGAIANNRKLVWSKAEKYSDSLTSRIYKPEK